MTRLLLTALLATASLAQAQRIPVTTTSDEARVHYVRGETALFYNEPATARGHFDAALAADPEFAMAHAYRAAATPPAEEEVREEHLRRAQQQNAHISEPERQWIAAIQAGTSGDTDAQNETLRALAAIVPDDPKPLFVVSYAEASAGNPAAAVEAARRAIAVDPSYAPVYNALGYAEMAAGNRAAAEAAFREQIRLAPHHANPYDSYGDFFMAADQWDEAEAQFQLALTHNPSFQASRNKLTRIAILRAWAELLAAYNRQDPVGLADAFTANAVVTPASRAQIVGRDAIREFLTGMFESGRYTVESETQEITPMGEGFAYQRAVSTERFEDGTEYRSIETSVWTETPEGWKISRYTWTPAPAEDS